MCMRIGVGGIATGRRDEINVVLAANVVVVGNAAVAAPDFVAMNINCSFWMYTSSISKIGDFSEGKKPIGESLRHEVLPYEHEQ